MTEQDNTLEKSFWEAERRHRRSRGVSQAEASQMLGVHQTILSRKETNGGKIPDRETVLRFASELDLDSIEREVFLTSGGLAWTQSFYRDVLKMLNGDNDLTDRAFTNGEIEVILAKSLQVLRRPAA